MDQGEVYESGEKRDGFERYLNLGIEQDLMVYWMQGNRAVLGCGRRVGIGAI